MDSYLDFVNAMSFPAMLVTDNRIVHLNSILDGLLVHDKSYYIDSDPFEFWARSPFSLPPKEKLIPQILEDGHLILISPYIRTDGIPGTLELVITHLSEPSTDTITLLLMFRDLTKETQESEELHRVSAILDKVFSAANIGSFVVNRQGKEEGEAEWSPILRRIFGISDPKLFNAAPRWDLIHPDDLSHIQNSIFSAERDEYFPPVSDFRLIRPDGELRYCRGHIGTVKTALSDFIGVVIAVQDLTDLYAREDQFHQSQKLQSIGRIATGLKDEFGDFLFKVSDIVKKLESEEPGPGHRALVGEILSAADSLSKVTNDLLSYSRKKKHAKEKIEINQSLMKTLSLLENQLPHSINIQFLLEDSMFYAHLDLSLFQTTIVNIILNAVDAMPAGGKLTLSTSRFEQSEMGEKNPLLTPGVYYAIMISDEGHGMSDEERVQILDPFYTTKTNNKGLGLSMAYGFIRQSGGELEIESDPGKGTSVRLLFPAYATQVGAT